MSQPHLIDQVLKDLQLDGDGVDIKDTPAMCTKILSAFPEGKPHDGHFHYRTMIGKLNSLEKSSRPDIAYAVHQCTRYSTDPKMEHANAV